MENRKLSNTQFIKEVLGICLSAPKKLKKGLIICCVCIGISTLFSALIPVISGYVLNSLKDSISQNVLTGILLLWTFFYVLSGKIGLLFDEIVDSFSQVVYQRYNVLFRLKKIASVFNMPAIVASSEFRQNMVASIPRLGSLGENTIYSFIWNIFWQAGFVFSYITLFCIAPVYSLIILAISIFQAYFTLWINNRLKEKSEALVNYEKDNNTSQQDALENLQNIRMLGIHNQVMNELNDKHEHYFYDFQSYQIKQIFFSLIPNTVSLLSQCILIYMAVQIAFEKQDIGLYVMLSGLSMDVLRKVDAVINRYKWLHNYGIQYLTLNKELQYDTSLMPKSGKGKLSTIKEIALEKVCFTYPEEKSPVLNNLSLKIKAGSRVAIIGNSGMGKSTLINVMQHAYEIQSGKVLYNGKNVQTISRESLRDNLTYIDQHPTFWSQKTIKENLLMFNPKATDAELYQALRSANLLDEITQKERGIDSKVTTLSAGQKQRLSLARALLRHTPLIIMDEPTANLDTHAQTKVLEGIKNLSKVKGQKPTVIFASNVPAEIASANRILLLENGQIVEDGTPKKLMTNERSKTYKRLKKYKALFMD